MVGPTNTEVTKFVFMLLPKFSLMAFTSAIEPLRIANRLSGREIYGWRLASDDGVSATCSAAVTVSVEMGLDSVDRNETIMFCGGLSIKPAVTPRVLNWIRREARKGMPIGGLCTATYLMAKAGLLDGRQSTIHWENRESFIEDFPDQDITTSIFTIDKNRYSSAGGTAAADLMLRLIANEHGTDLANGIADQMIYTTVRTDKDQQRLSIPTRIGVRHAKLSTVIKMMEGNLEEPISPAILADDVGISTRQLERLFRRYLNRSPKRYYMELRLEKARNLLLQTDMSVINVALASGFTSPSHFSKCYRMHFSTTPYRERGAQGN
jgi:transcriptional regulator GlxA family with amidase domain